MGDWFNEVADLFFFVSFDVNVVPGMEGPILEDG